MTRVLLNYPRGWPKDAKTVKKWTKRLSSLWSAEHPDEPLEGVSIRGVIDDSCDTLEPDMMKAFHSLVVVDTQKRGARYIDDRSAQLAREALVDGKECWVYRNSAEEEFLRVADLKVDEDGRNRVLVRRRKRRRKQP